MEECVNVKLNDMSNKIVVVTGANSGLGLQTVKDLVKVNANVIMGCRSINKCNDAKASIVKLQPDADRLIRTEQLDLASFESIKDFAKQMPNNIDVLINNAGIMAIPTRQLTTDGLEAQMGTNHIGHFLLTSLLLPKITKHGRIINHSSGAHMFAAKNFTNDLFSEKSYDPWTAYGNSKAANLLFTYELNDRFSKSNKNLIAIAVHPGYTATNLQADRFPLWEFNNLAFAMKVEHGVLSQTLAATSPSIKASYNDFYGPKYLAFGYPSVQITNKADKNAQLELWNMSVKLTKKYLVN